MNFPNTIIYGHGSLEKVGEEAAKLGGKALIISDRIMKELGYLKECHDYLEQAGIPYIDYLEVDQEPTDIFVREALEKQAEHRTDIMIALGGGSCIDTAKAAAVLAANDGEIHEYMNNRKRADKLAQPLIAIPTTAGTGSEATDVTIITNTSNDVKMMIKQPAFMPASAIVDAKLSMSSPPGTTAATGVDALTHAIEAYISRKAHPFSDQLALSSAKLIMENMKAVYDNGSNEKAREGMALGALQGGMAFSNSSVCLVHGMSRPIGALFHVPHGISNAMLLPVVLEFTKESCEDRLAEMARFIYPEKMDWQDPEAAVYLVDEVLRLCRQLDIPNMKAWGVAEEEFFYSLPKMAEDAVESGSPGNNPRVPEKEEIIALYKEAFTYEYPAYLSK
ncbi:iron-containing alcohol dehydrogenase [Alteribacillus sp. HJP-4]|uniref:iron-containing alcohol dehydrogenase n=1 Tax=Alteribacillus sp. HJP-4 TaxID=2775394 RepID=UPI0035CCD054